jgi:hypothetical protein
MATIKDFIEKITVDQFYSWWNNTSEKDVPQKVTVLRRVFRLAVIFVSLVTINE